ncbi:MAG: protein kinase [Kofleriaceae bacterium]|nr:protein kinase [Kofleriaceae bacterium]
MGADPVPGDVTAAVASPTSRSGVRAAYRRVVHGVTLADDAEVVYERERMALNRRNIRVVTLATLALHAISVVVYARQAADWTDVPRSFHATVAWVHLLALPLVTTLAALVSWVEPRRWPPGWRAWATDLYAFAYLMIGAALSINAQRLNGNVNVYTIASLAGAIALRQRTTAVILGQAAGVTAMVIGVLQVQHATPLRMAALAPVLAVAVLTIVLARASVAAMRAEIAARLTIERQRAELATNHDALERLNGDLERRVQAQVAEIVARAGEIDRLNHHLRTQVIDRSRQLAHALKALGKGEALPLAPGVTLDGRVEIREQIGVGAMGEVYRGADRILARDVAVKVLRADSGVSTDLWVRFAAEAEAAAAIHHPAVVPTLHVGIADDGRLYQLQELADGVPLSRLLEDGGPWAPGAAARVGAGLAEALAAAHAAGIVHRDVKPGNVMVGTTAPAVRLLDFGVSKVLGSDADAGIVVGTPAYMAPEQMTASTAVDAAADVYATGVVLHELIAGTRPFVGGTATLLDPAGRAAPPRLSAQEAPPALAALIQRCLAPDPAARPTAAALAAELTAIADAAGAPAAHALPRPRSATRDGSGATVRLRAPDA